MNNDKICRAFFGNIGFWILILNVLLWTNCIFASNVNNFYFDEYRVFANTKSTTFYLDESGFSLSPHIAEHKNGEHSALHLKFINNTSNGLNVTADNRAKSTHYSKDNVTGTVYWKSNRIQCHNIWEGITLELYVDPNTGNIGYELIVEEEVCTEALFEISGCETMKIDEFGQLELAMPSYNVTETKPFGRGEESNGDYRVERIKDGNRVGFVLPEERSEMVRIDPEFIFGSFIGSVGFTIGYLGYVAGYDNAGNIYGGGSTGVISTSPTEGHTYVSNDGEIVSSQYGIVSKFDPLNGQLLWEVVFVASPFGQLVSPVSIQPLPNGNMACLFVAHEDLFPYTDLFTWNDYENDLYSYNYAELSSDGLLIRSILVASSNLLPSMAFDGNGLIGKNRDASLFVDFLTNTITISCSVFADLWTSSTSYRPILTISPDFFLDVYTIVLDATTLEPQYATYLSDSGQANVTGVVKSDDQIILVGRCNGDLPTTSGVIKEERSAFDFVNGFIAVFNDDLSELIACTYLGSDDIDTIIGVDVNSNGQIVVAALIEENDDYLPGEENYQVEGSANYIVGVSPDLTAIEFVGTFGSAEGFIVPTALMVDDCDHIYVSGHGNGDQIIGADLTPDAFSTQGGFYLAKFEPGMQGLEFATLLGGNHTDGGMSNFDPKGVVYQGVCSVFGDPFLTSDNAWDSEQASGVELGVYKIDLQSDASVAAFNYSLEGVCAPIEVETINYSTEGEYQWWIDGELINVDESPNLLFEEPGVHELQLVVTNESSCNVTDTTTVLLHIPESADLDLNWNTVLEENCDATSVIAEFTGTADEWVWSVNGEALNDNDPEINFSSDNPDAYTLTLSATDTLCVFTDSISLDWVYEPGSYSLQSLVTDSCSLPLQVQLNLESEGLDGFNWVTPQGNSNEANLSLQQTEQGTLEVILQIEDEDCLGSIQEMLTFNALGTVNANATPNEATTCFPAPVVFEGEQNLGSGYWNINGEIIPVEILEFIPEQESPQTWWYIAEASNTCNEKDSVSVEVNVGSPPLGDFIVINDNGLCDELWEVQLLFDGENADIVEWQVNDEILLGPNQLLNLDESQVLEIEAEAYNPICEQRLVFETQINVVTGEGEDLKFIPNVFTPNGDQKNDDFRPFQDLEASYVSDYSITIRNRWGQEVFSSTDPKEAWKGKQEGSLLAPGTFFYILKFFNRCTNQSEERTGVVILLGE